MHSESSGIRPAGETDASSAGVQLARVRATKAGAGTRPGLRRTVAGAEASLRSHPCFSSRPFRAFPYASKNARRKRGGALVSASGPILHFTLNHYTVQLDLFIPYEYGYEFKVIVTNKALQAKKLVRFHEGRGSQEGIFAALKSQCQMGYVPVRTRVGNQLYLLAGRFAHNLIRELQMTTTPRSRRTTAKRAALWVFEELHTFRSVFLRRAGRLTWPQGKLTLTVSAASRIKTRLLQLRATLQAA